MVGPGSSTCSIGDEDEYQVGRDYVEFEQAQTETLQAIRKNLRRKLHEGTVTVQDINEASDTMENLGIPENFIMDHTFGNGRYPLLDETYELMFRAVVHVGSVHEGLAAIYQSLVRCFRTLLQYKRTCIYLPDDITTVQLQLAKIDRMDVGGVITTPDIQKTLMPGENPIPEGQAILKNLLHKCHKLAHWLLIQSEVDPELEYLYQHLISLKRRVDVFVGRAQSAKDLGPISTFSRLGARRGVTLQQISEVQRELDNVDRAKVNGNFVTKSGQIPKGQGAMSTLLEYLYTQVSDLMSSEEADKHRVHPEFSKLYTELLDIEKELLQMKHEAVTLMELEIRPIQIRLRAIEDQRVNGKIMSSNIEGEVLPGQAIIHRLLSRCYELVHELLVMNEDALPTDPDTEHQVDTYVQYKGLLEVRAQLKALKNQTGVTLKDIVKYEEPLEKLAVAILDDKNTSRANNALRGLCNETYNLLFEVLVLKDL